MLNKLIILLSAVGLVGAYAAGYSRANKSNQIESMQATIASPNSAVVAERNMITVANKKSQELALQLNSERQTNASIKKQIEKDKNNINKLNTINHEFVRYIQLSETNNVPQVTGTPSKLSTSSGNISADRVLHYTVDLRSAYNQCMHQTNNIIEYYNEQRELINN